MNVNGFCKLFHEPQTLSIQPNSKAADNKGFKEMAGDLVNQTVVLPIKCSSPL